MTIPIATAVLRQLRAIPDYPKPGILFQDITPVLAEAELFRRAVEAMAAPFLGADISHVVGIEARGFILGGPVAVILKAGFVPVRKPGKLPWKSRRREYALEYGANVVEIHDDGLSGKHRALIVDDVLATGGTAAAAAELVRDLGATVAGWSFLLEIAPLRGREKLAGAPASTVAVV